MIICAAIKYYIEATEKEVILCGRRHYNIIEQLENLGFKPNKGYKTICQGFINDKGLFLNRQEAYKEAKKCNQLFPTVSEYETELFSEYLW